MLIWVGGRLLLTGVNLTSKTFLSLTSFIAAPYAGIKFTMIPKLNIPELTARKNMIFLQTERELTAVGAPYFVISEPENRIN